MRRGRARWLLSAMASAAGTGQTVLEAAGAGAPAGAGVLPISKSSDPPGCRAAGLSVCTNTPGRAAAPPLPVPAAAAFFEAGRAAPSSWLCCMVRRPGRSAAAAARRWRTRRRHSRRATAAGDGGTKWRPGEAGLGRLMNTVRILASKQKNTSCPIKNVSLTRQGSSRAANSAAHDRRDARALAWGLGGWRCAIELHSCHLQPAKLLRRQHGFGAGGQGCAQLAGRPLVSWCKRSCDQQAGRRQAPAPNRAVARCLPHGHCGLCSGPSCKSRRLDGSHYLRNQLHQ